jgi:hypothetical protein
LLKPAREMLKRIPILAICLIGSFCSLININAQEISNSLNKQADYIQVLTQRSNKIVASLGITDSTKFYQVQQIITQQYVQLGKIHDSANASIKVAKMDTSKAKAAATISKIESDRTIALDKLHLSYISNLKKLVTETQLVTIKDGMTYNILPITYKAYGEMILTLTEEQKKQIYTYLVEAREHAIDAESSDKKHAMFGKYKGKINNYLSAAGYDMKKEGDEWQKRIKDQKDTNKKTE